MSNHSDFQARLARIEARHGAGAPLASTDGGAIGEDEAQARPTMRFGVIVVGLVTGFGLGLAGMLILI
ncbi:MULTISPECIES: hypothetical protein [unclassified Rhodosalinus]|uniref:hypothetical protein n=1 Tax=unclassified Rhodosalinus TaxID=2630183 RepID=UPI0035233E8B